MPPWRAGWRAVLLAAALIAAACSGGDGEADDGPGSTSSTTTSTTTTEPGDDPDVPVVVVAPLTGERLDGDVPAQPRALVVKIGNNDDRARPQAGLVEADIVFEEQIEGLKTRFAAVFHTEVPDRIGPVRSGRSSDLELVAGLGQPYLAYSGGNPTVLGQFRAGVESGLFIDIGILENEDPYTRDETRDAPDNLYFDFREATLVAGDSPPSILLDHESPIGSAVDDLGDGIVVRYPTSFGRESIHVWDPVAQGWVRIQDGTVHTAEADRRESEIAPANVVVLEIVYIESPADAESPQAVTFGAGAAWILVDGKVFVGRWERSLEEPAFRLVDGVGQPIGLSPGPTWILLANDGAGSPKFGAAEIEVLVGETAAEMLANARELASGNGETAP